MGGMIRNEMIKNKNKSVLLRMMTNYKHFKPKKYFKYKI